MALPILVLVVSGLHFLDLPKFSQVMRRPILLLALISGRKIRLSSQASVSRSRIAVDRDNPSISIDFINWCLACLGVAIVSANLLLIRVGVYDAETI